MPIFAMEKSILNKSVFFPLQVTWIRHRDVHILTVGQYTYTTDQRFLARHNPATDEWTLVIKYVQERDAGIYECQIPSRILQSYPINLNIVGKYITEFVLGTRYLPWLSWWWLGCSAIIYIRQPASFPAQPTNEHLIDPLRSCSSSSTIAASSFIEFQNRKIIQ